MTQIIFNNGFRRMARIILLLQPKHVKLFVLVVLFIKNTDFADDTDYFYYG